jgi:hypothetical protein
MTFEMTVVMVALIIFIILTGLMLYTGYSAKSDNPWPPYQNSCPDYWTPYGTSNSTCIIPSETKTNYISYTSPATTNANIRLTFSLANELKTSSSAQITPPVVNIPSGTSCTASAFNAILIAAFDANNLYYTQSSTKYYFVYFTDTIVSTSNSYNNVILTMNFSPIPKIVGAVYPTTDSTTKVFTDSTASITVPSWYFTPAVAAVTDASGNVTTAAVPAGPYYTPTTNGTYEYLKVVIDTTDSNSGIIPGSYPAATTTASLAQTTYVGNNSYYAIDDEDGYAMHGSAQTIDFTTYSICDKKTFAKKYNVEWNGISYGNDLICP